MSVLISACPQVLEVVRKYNADPNVDGILVQLPLPEHINEEKILDAISIEKDVDGVTESAEFLLCTSSLRVLSLVLLGRGSYRSSLYACLSASMMLISMIATMLSYGLMPVLSRRLSSNQHRPPCNEGPHRAPFRAMHAQGTHTSSSSPFQGNNLSQRIRTVLAAAPNRSKKEFRSIQQRLRPFSTPPQGCIELLKRCDVPIKGARAVVVGRSNVVGMPAAMLLQRLDATVTVVHSRTQARPSPPL